MLPYDIGLQLGESWDDRKATIKRAGNLGGFAAQPVFLAGQPLIWVAGGLVYTADDFHSGKIVFNGTMYNEAHLSETLRIATPVAFHYYINHSCEPNIIDQSRHPTVTHYVAMRDIRTGEELTADYYTLETLEVCFCSSPWCRWKPHS